MKKIAFYFILAGISLALTSKAQTQKGNVLIGGDIANAGLYFSSFNVFNINLTPKVAWFVNDNIAVGGYVNMGFASSSSNSSSTTIVYGIGPLGRYYFGKQSDGLSRSRFFAEANIGLNGYHYSGGYGSGNGMNFGVGPGFAYFVTSDVSLETLLRYNGSHGFYDDKNYSNNLALTFGLQFFLEGKKAAKK
ncbi:MAG: hypothetical protein ACXVAY_01240 [Mucilaginibacter sp.]